MRRLIPEDIVAFFKRKELIIGSGVETKLPAKAVEYYKAALEEASYPIVGKRVLLFGYGG